MSDVKPARRPVGYVLGVAALCLLLLLLAALMNDGWGLSRRGWMGWIVAAIAVLGMILFFLYGPVYGTWIWFSRLLFREHRRGTASEVRLLKRDPRLQHIYEELRISHGWFWRRRLRWLLVNGTDQRIDQIAPGLKQAGIMHVDGSILVHVSPDGIEAAKWLYQIRRLRRRRPVDGVVHVACANDTNTELPRTLSGIATALGWAAPVTFLHPVDAENDQPERFDAVGAFMPDVARGQAQATAAGLVNLLDEVEQRTAIEGVRQCGEPAWINSMLKISEYIGNHTERMIGHLRALAASNWLRAPLAGVMFAPVFPGATAVKLRSPRSCSRASNHAPCCLSGARLPLARPDIVVAAQGCTGRTYSRGACWPVRSPGSCCS